MSSITAADLKLGGRLVAACDAIGAGHLRKAAGIFNELAEELNIEAETTTGLLAPDEDETLVLDQPVREAPPITPQLTVARAPVGLQMCARGVHSYSAPDPVSGWRTCASCQMVNVAPPENSGPIDMSARQ